MKIRTDENGGKNSTVIGMGVIQDSTIIVHGSGKPFVRYLYSNMMDLLIEDFKRNIAAQYDNVIVIEGGEGKGKSNLAWEICKRFDPDVVMEDCYVYDFDDLKNKILSLKGEDKGKIFWLDETSNMANNRAWMTQNNQYLVQILEMMRSRGWTLCLNIPSMDRLDLYIREYRYKYRLTCASGKFDHSEWKDRGYFEVHKKIDGEEKHIGYGEYHKMSDEDAAIYAKIKDSSQMKKFDEILQGDKKPGARYKAMYEEERKKQRNIMLRMSQSGIDSKHIMDLFGYDDPQQYYNAISKAKREVENGY